MSRFQEGPSAQRSRPPRRLLLRIALVGLGLLFALGATVICVLVVLSPSTSILIGDLTGSQIGYAAAIASLIALPLFVICLPARRAWLFFKVPFGILCGLVAMLAITVLPLVADTKITPILVDGCPSGYIAIEPSGGGGSYVGVRDGIRVVAVQPLAGDDFDRPFASGDYSANRRGDYIEVTHGGAATRPAFSLAAMKTERCT